MPLRLSKSRSATRVNNGRLEACCYIGV